MQLMKEEKEREEGSENELSDGKKRRGCGWIYRAGPIATTYVVAIVQKIVAKNTIQRRHIVAAELAVGLLLQY